jgi:phage shock protein PspC (stress-responsive transcriptional regulator)
LALWTCKAKKCILWIFFLWFGFVCIFYLIFWMLEPKITHN